jgi:hypothetical protein
MHLGYGKNRLGHKISLHRCDTCGQRFTLIPPVAPNMPGWGNCLSESCESYDMSRDVDLFFGTIPITRGPLAQEESDG